MDPNSIKTKSDNVAEDFIHFFEFLLQKAITKDKHLFFINISVLHFLSRSMQRTFVLCSGKSVHNYKIVTFQSYFQGVKIQNTNGIGLMHKFNIYANVPNNAKLGKFSQFYA